MAYYRRSYRRSYKKRSYRKRSSIFSKLHYCKWRRKYNKLQRELYMEATYY